MADPPPIRRPPSGPPPIPRLPIAPAASKTDVVPSQGEELHEDTQSLKAPDPEALIERMLELVASEAEALLEGDAARLADLNVRSALASWDALHQTDDALRLLELAEGHPLVPRLRLQAALAVGDTAALEATERAHAT